MIVRRSGIAAGIFVLMLAGPVLSQTKQRVGSVPFFPNDWERNLERFADQMFGESTADEQQFLAEIKISFAEETAFGTPQVEAFMADLKQQGIRVNGKGKDVAYVRQLVSAVQPMMVQAGRYEKLTIYVVDSPNVDARSFPGGTLFFYKGLLAFAETEAALIGIVGHELSHLDREHQLLPLKRGRIIEQQAEAAAKAFDSRKFATGSTMIMRLMSRPFRPEDEATADSDGAAWAYRSGYDPREMARLFARLHQRTNDPKLPFAGFFRSHPYNEDRRDAIAEKFTELRTANPDGTLYRGKKNLALRTAKSEQKFPE